MTAIARPGTPFPHQSSISHNGPLSPTRHFAQPLHFHMPAVPTPTPPSLLQRSSSSGSTSSFTGYRSRSTSATPSLPSYSTLPAAVAAPRRASAFTIPTTSSSSTSSPAYPITPLPLEAENPIAPRPTPLELPAPLYSLPNNKQITLPTFNLSEPSTSTHCECGCEAEQSEREGQEQADDDEMDESEDEFISQPPPRRALSLERTARLCAESEIFDDELVELDSTKFKISIQQPTRPKFRRRDTPRPPLATLSNLGCLTQRVRRNSKDKERDAEKKYTSVVNGSAWVAL